MSLSSHRERIVSAIAGDLPPNDEADLRAHLRTCDECRQLYDHLSLTAHALAPAQRIAQARERTRLARALASADGERSDNAGEVASPEAAPKREGSRRGARWALLGLLPVAAAAALFVVLRPAAPTRAPATPPSIAWRGEMALPKAEAFPPQLTLRVYVRRRGSDGIPGPVLLAGEMPGSGEMRASGNDDLQLVYAGLTAPRYLAIFARDERGQILRLFPPLTQSGFGVVSGEKPRPVVPSLKPRPLGQPLNLATHAGRRWSLSAYISPNPIDPDRLEQRLRRPADQAPAPLHPTLETTLLIDP